jgi:hypothetical protein
MNKAKSGFKSVLFGCLAAAFGSTAFALPSLQLGPTAGAPGWTYDEGSETWVFSGAENATANLSAFANATQANGGNGAFAWDAAGDAARWAYLVVSAVPKLGEGDGDAFDINVTGATFLTSGFGNPPLEDTNDLAPHGIFDTYFEIYKFRFDGAIVDIENTEPPGGDPGKGYAEAFGIDINSLLDGVTGLHFDLFTVKGNGVYTPNGPTDRTLVLANAPFSHDAEWTPDDPDDPDDPDVPAPGTLLLMGLGLAALSRMRLRS